MKEPQHIERGGQRASPRRFSRIRPWVQVGFLGLWLAPVGRWMQGFPGCVFHCYACPLSALACPVGLAANYAAAFSFWQTVPFLLIGVLVLAGALVGSLVCGWACPFGFLQDLLGRVRSRKWLIPAWLGNLRFAVLVGMVLFLPWYLGTRGIPYEDQAVSICRLCPAGALEAGVYYSVSSVVAGTGWVMSWYKVLILVVFLAAAVMIQRPWCRVLCPLGGFLSLFNRFSLFHLRFNPRNCVQCNLCRSRCAIGVKVDQRVNTRECIRCLECTTCGALEPAMAVPAESGEPVKR